MAATLTWLSIWAAMTVWVAAILSERRLARRLWTIGLALYFAHILLAFHTHYQWSHRVAWDETARQTFERLGMRTGIGLIVNYAFGLVLLWDLVYQYRENERWSAWIVDGFVVFMIVNGALIFGKGAVQWYGLILVAILGCAFFFRRR